MGRSPGGRPPAATAGRPYFKAIAGKNLNADLLGAQHAWRTIRRYQTVIVRNSVFAAKHSARTIARAIARRVRKRRLGGFQHQVELDAETAAKLSVSTRTGTEFVVTEMQGKPYLGDLNATELDAADRVPFADRRPAVAA